MTQAAIQLVEGTIYNPILPNEESLPTMYDLPSEDSEEPGLPDEFHYYQPQLLRETFQPTHYLPDRYLVGTDLNLYNVLTLKPRQDKRQKRKSRSLKPC